MLAGWRFVFQRKKLSFIFFKIRKSTSTRLRSMKHYYESKVHTLKMCFPSFFLLQNENYAWFLNKNSIKIFFQVLEVTYNDKLLEICFGFMFFISDNARSIWALQRSIFEFWKKSSIFPFERQKANSLFYKKLSQIVRYGQIIIGIV